MSDVPDHAEMPVIVGVPAPLRLVAREGGDQWSVTLDDVNRSTYDWVKLSRVSGAFDGNIAPFAMLICFDGSLVIPALPEFPHKQRAVEVFNRVLAELLLGGEYTEAIMPVDVCPGVILPTGYVRISTMGAGATSRLHVSLRSGEASQTDSIALLGTHPVPIKDIEAKVHRGRAVLSAVPTLSPDLFLAGTTHFVREQWSEALVALWTSTEQLLTHLWEVHIRAAATEGIPGRKAFLADYRTWPVSSRIEVLFQRGIIGETLYRELDSARKARNAFIHDGRSPSVEASIAAIRGVFDLLARSSRSASAESDVARAKEMVLARVEVRAAGSRNRRLDPTEVVAWRAIRHLPGEKGWDGEFERFDLGFKPLEEIRQLRPRKRSPKS
jgi:hypothetical protein